jgi:hypothetical protein
LGFINNSLISTPDSFSLLAIIIRHTIVDDLTARGATGSFIHGGFELGGGSIRQGAALSFLDGTHHHVLRDGQMNKSISKSDNTIAIAIIAWLDKVDTLVDLIEAKVAPAWRVDAIASSMRLGTLR